MASRSPNTEKSSWLSHQDYVDTSRLLPQGVDRLRARITKALL